MGGWWVVSAKIKDQQGLMKDRVREGERYSERQREMVFKVFCQIQGEIDIWIKNYKYEVRWMLNHNKAKIFTDSEQGMETSSEKCSCKILIVCLCNPILYV